MFVVFGAHTDPAVCGFWLTQIPRISLIFLWVVNLTELFGGRVGVVFGLTQIPRIPLIFLWAVNLTELFSGGVSGEFIYLCGDCVC